MHYYAVPIRPVTPLRVGQTVRVLALSRTAFHAPNTVFPRYETYDPHVRGLVAAVVGVGEEAITFELDNQCDINPIKKVRLTIRWIQNITAVGPSDPPGEGNIPHEHRAPMLEEDVTIAEADRRTGCGAEGCRGPRLDGVGTLL